MPKKLVQEEVIARFREVHGDKFDYSKVKFEKVETKVCIICHEKDENGVEHGEFWQTPNNHFRGKGCPKCRLANLWNKRGRRSLDMWIDLFHKKHGTKYDYSLIQDIKRGKDVIEIVCKDCGLHFFQPAARHKRGDGCPICNGGTVYTKEQFIEKSKSKFGDKFLYLGEYKNNHTPILLECPIHGEFSITPQHHLNSPYGCPDCAIGGRAEKKTLPVSNIVKRLINAHGDSIILKEDTYTDIITPCTFICQEHGEFTQSADKMLHGCKCPYCTEPLGEKKIREYLTINDYKFQPQYRVDIGKLFGRSKLRIDFMVFLGDKKVAIEFNGLQHYKKIDYFHKSEEDFAEQQDRDEDVRKWCKLNKIKLIEIRYEQINEIESILKRKLK